MDLQEKLREFAIETLIEEKREAAFEEEKKELERLQEEKKRKIAELVSKAGNKQAIRGNLIYL
jgi:predicted helicase